MSWLEVYKTLTHHPTSSWPVETPRSLACKPLTNSGSISGTVRHHVYRHPVPSPASFRKKKKKKETSRKQLNFGVTFLLQNVCNLFYGYEIKCKARRAEQNYPGFTSNCKLVDEIWHSKVLSLKMASNVEKRRENS